MGEKLTETRTFGAERTARVRKRKIGEWNRQIISQSENGTGKKRAAADPRGATKSWNEIQTFRVRLDMYGRRDQSQERLRVGGPARVVHCDVQCLRAKLGTNCMRTAGS